MSVFISDTRDISKSSIVALYEANHWSAANKPEELYNALMYAHSLYSAWDGEKLVGIGNAISDGHLVVYYPHLLVHPEYQGRGIGQQIMEKLKERYAGIHMQMLTADVEAVGFYEKIGFIRAGKTEPMWIYDGNEH